MSHRESPAQQEPEQLVHDIPDFSRRVALGSTAVAILIGPPAIGRSRIISRAVELYPDFSTEPALTSPASDASVPLHLIGVVAPPLVWSHHFMNSFRPGSQERTEQLQRACTYLEWMRAQASDTLPVLYTSSTNVDTAVHNLYDHLTGKEVLRSADRHLIDELHFTAETIGM